MTATIEERIGRMEGELARLSEIVERGMREATPPASLPGESLVGEKHPLAHLAGRLRDHPLLGAWRDAVEEQRRQLDETEGVA